MRITLEYRDDQDLPAVPKHDDGSNYQYAMAHDDNLVTFADTAGELVALMIDGYEELGPDEDDQALIVRYQHLLLLAGHYQAVANGEAMAAGLLDAADEVTLNALYCDRTVPYDGPPEWAGPRLFLMATDYEPYADRLHPEGNVLLLDPAKETGYLHALHSLGFVGFWCSVGAEPEAVLV